MDTIFTIYEQPQKAYKFRDKLISLRGHQCECCKNTHWLDLPITLEVHHKNGDKKNNTQENLILLCPNCHSYTDNYGSKNKKNIEISDDELALALSNSFTIREALLSVGLSDAGVNYTRARKIIASYNITLKQKQQKPKEGFCIECNKPIFPGAIRCSKCHTEFSRNKTLSRDELKLLIRTVPFTQIGKKYGVTDNAVRKWCDNYNLPRKVSEIKQYSDEEWDKL